MKKTIELMDFDIENEELDSLIYHFSVNEIDECIKIIENMGIYNEDINDIGTLIEEMKNDNIDMVLREKISPENSLEIEIKYELKEHNYSNSSGFNRWIYDVEIVNYGVCNNLI